MFKTLEPLARLAPVTLTIFPAGDALRVLIAQKKGDGETFVPVNHVITGTAAELDTELPLALAEAAALPEKSIADQVKEQAASNKTAAEAAEADDADGKPAKKKPVKRTASAKLIKPKVRTLKKPSTKPAKKVAPKKVVTKATKKVTPVPSPIIKPLIKRTDSNPDGTRIKRTKGDPDAKRAACLADLNTARLSHGDKLTRRLFLADAKTGKSFETVFGSWDKFIAAAVPQILQPETEGTVTAHAPGAAAEPLRAEEPAATPAPLVTPVPTGPDLFTDPAAAAQDTAPAQTAVNLF